MKWLEIPLPHQDRPLSPRGRGMRSLSERSELRRSWVRGRAEGAQRASATMAKIGAALLALLRARAAFAARPLIQLQLGSASPRQASVSFSRKGRRGASRVLLAVLLATLALAPAACGKKGAPVLPEGKTDQFPHRYPQSTEPQQGVFN